MFVFFKYINNYKKYFLKNELLKIYNTYIYIINKFLLKYLFVYNGIKFIPIFINMKKLGFLLKYYIK